MFHYLLAAGWLASLLGAAKAAYLFGRRAEQKAAAELKKIESKL